MSLRGIELRTLLPRLEEVGQVQRRGDEGAAQERFAAQFNQEVEQKRQGVQQTGKPSGERINQSEPREKRRGQPGQERRRRKRPPQPENVPRHQGRLDVRT